MAIKQTTSMASIQYYLEKRIKENNDLVIKRLSRIGEMYIREARTKGSYTDQTENQRNSIGYVIADNGNVVQSSGFEKGGPEGRKLAYQLANNEQGTAALILVAGTNYASYVAAKGYDVLDSAELITPRLMKQLGFK